MRAVWNAIQYIASTGCQWAQLPKEFPPFTTVQYYFYQLHYFYQLRDSLIETIERKLAENCR